MSTTDTGRAEPLPNGVDALIDLLTARTVEVTRLTREVARLDAVVTAVREVHQPAEWGDDGDGTGGVDCSSCVEEPYPCPTVRALDGGAR